ncbi:hypothetical protein BK797_22755 [Kosakonia sacchari]|nr:hypothetical protein BK797_22755 [Kosakonia sacchari]
MFDEWVFYFHDLHTLLLSPDRWQPQKNRRIIPLFLRCATGRRLIAINQTGKEYIARIRRALK